MKCQGQKSLHYIIGNVHRRDRQFTFGTYIEPKKCKKKDRESGQSALSGPLRVVL